MTEGEIKRITEARRTIITSLVEIAEMLQRLESAKDNLTEVLYGRNGAANGAGTPFSNGKQG